MILNCTPLFSLPLASGSPASATFHRRKLSIEALRRQSGRKKTRYRKEEGARR
jgi:hypothetical protein